MSPTAPRVNDFTIKIATVNGTGSASANTLLMKSIFRSGIPVVGKNYFPSNIQGLPTWYEIRVTRDGYAARSERVDLMVANDVSAPDAGFEVDTNRAVLLDANGGVEETALLTKYALAELVLVIRKELDVSMALCGLRDVREASPAIVRRA